MQGGVTSQMRPGRTSIADSTSIAESSSAALSPEVGGAAQRRLSTAPSLFVAIADATLFGRAVNEFERQLLISQAAAVATAVATRLSPLGG